MKPFAVGMLVAGCIVTAPSATTHGYELPRAGVGTVRHLTVLLPDGRPAAGATVFALVYGSADEPALRVPHVFTADSAGLVSIDIPRSDPVIANAAPGEQLFSVQAFVFDGGPLGRDTEIYPLPYVLNLGDATWPADPTGIDGSVITLATPSSQTAGGDGAAGPLSATSSTDEPCQVEFPLVWVCTTTTFPQSLHSVPVPVIENASAGRDFRTTFSYETSASTLTSTLTGTDGLFVEVKSSSTVEQTSEVDGYVSRAGISGGTTDGRVRVATTFKQERNSACSIAVNLCKIYYTVRPYSMVGTVSTEPAKSHHDTLRALGSLDCSNYVSRGTHWTNSQGVTREMSFTIGFDVSATIQYFELHAVSTVTRESEVTRSESISWEVDEIPDLPHHYVFVPDGLDNSDPTNAEGAACPVITPGGTYTDASHDGRKSLDAPPPLVPEEVQNEVKRAHAASSRCIAAPERCGQRR